MMFYHNSYTHVYYFPKIVTSHDYNIHRETYHALYQVIPPVSGLLDHARVREVAAGLWCPGWLLNVCVHLK